MRRGQARGQGSDIFEFDARHASYLAALGPRCKVEFIISALEVTPSRIGDIAAPMIDLDFTFSGEMWRWQSETATAWHFITLPAELSEDIKAFTKHLVRGFRSVKVEVRIGETTWKTSLFPSKDRGAYILPIKKSVRAAENMSAGSVVTVYLRVPT